MRKHTTLLLASAAVALSASGAFARSAMYPGDHLVDYDPINQAYEWRLNDDGGATVQPGYHAFAAAKRVHTVAPRTSDELDPWQKARIDDANEARGD